MARASAEGLHGYFDACATTPPSDAVDRAMAEAGRRAWANASSLHGLGIDAALSLERSRALLAQGLGAAPEQLVFCSGGSEAIQLALLGSATRVESGRLVISAVEHPATEAAAHTLERRGWSVARMPVDRRGRVVLDDLDDLLAPPTRMVSMIWGQSEVGTVQPIERIGAACRARGIPFHVDAVQMLGHRAIDLARLPVDLLSCTAHKLRGPKGIGLLAMGEGTAIEPLVGGAQEGGRRGGTESVVLAAGFAAALANAIAPVLKAAGRDPIADLRDDLWDRLRSMPGLRLTGPDPHQEGLRLPHHLSLLVSSPDDAPLPGRQLVRALWLEGFAVSSGTACSSAMKGGTSEATPSPVLAAMGYPAAEAASSLRISLGDWLEPADIAAFPAALERARRRVMGDR